MGALHAKRTSLKPNTAKSLTGFGMSPRLQHRRRSSLRTPLTPEPRTPNPEPPPPRVKGTALYPVPVLISNYEEDGRQPNKILTDRKSLQLGLGNDGQSASGSARASCAFVAAFHACCPVASRVATPHLLK
jgi:hypothetical protein